MVFKILLLLSIFSCCVRQTSTAQLVRGQQVKERLLSGRTYTGKCIQVLDGDTFIFLDGQMRQHRIRLEGIDAPEKGMAYARLSKQLLAAILADQELRLSVVGRDRYGRTLATVFTGNRNVNISMISSGMAWHYARHSDNTAYVKAATEARNKRVGLWKEKAPLAPWTVRAYRRAGYSDARFKVLREQKSPEIRKFLKMQ